MTAPAEPAAAGGGGGGNVFTRKLGPLPTWAWLGIGLGVALAVANWRSNKAASQASQTQQPADTTSADVPPFVIQNYVDDNDAGTPGKPGPKGPKGPPGPPGKPGRKPPKFNYVAYKVKSGDTLTSIAKRHHFDGPLDVFQATTEALKQLNTTHSLHVLKQVEEAGVRGRLPAGITIYLPAGTKP